ncbi:hypothetical protein EK21DRAFT_115701 [Setomelanomma holmii]|uniref:Uncharacterized protein n=1 Tax=Setomelanomma holmii TaxID=210430 RepID=A0A9P4LJF7_9PLEO|nr:hypothetical protein EK21DRAFT_115701 [Setomelanomma holmii]
MPPLVTATSPAPREITITTPFPCRSRVISRSQIQMIRAQNATATFVGFNSITPLSPAASDQGRPVVTYHSTATQTLPPPNAAEFKVDYGWEPSNSETEHKMGIAGRGRYGKEPRPDILMYGKPFEVEMASTPMTYISSGFQTKDAASRSRDLKLAKAKSKVTAARFTHVVAECGYKICAVKDEHKIVHSEQHPVRIPLDKDGNHTGDEDIAGRLLPNLYLEELDSKPTPSPSPTSRYDSLYFNKAVSHLPSSNEPSLSMTPAASIETSPYQLPQPIPALAPSPREDAPGYCTIRPMVEDYYSEFIVKAKPIARMKNKHPASLARATPSRTHDVTTSQGSSRQALSRVDKATESATSRETVKPSPAAAGTIPPHATQWQVQRYDRGRLSRKRRSDYDDEGSISHEAKRRKSEPPNIIVSQAPRKDPPRHEDRAPEQHTSAATVTGTAPGFTATLAAPMEASAKYPTPPPTSASYDGLSPVHYPPIVSANIEKDSNHKYEEETKQKGPIGYRDEARRDRRGRGRSRSSAREAARDDGPREDRREWYRSRSPRRSLTGEKRARNSHRHSRSPARRTPKENDRRAYRQRSPARTQSAKGHFGVETGPRRNSPVLRQATQTEFKAADENILEARKAEDHSGEASNAKAATTDPDHRDDPILSNVVDSGDLSLLKSEKTVSMPNATHEEKKKNDERTADRDGKLRPDMQRYVAGGRRQVTSGSNPQCPRSIVKSQTEGRAGRDQRRRDGRHR